MYEWTECLTIRTAVILYQRPVNISSKVIFPGKQTEDRGGKKNNF